MEKTTLYLPSGTLNTLRGLSKRTGRPQAELLREAIDQFLGEQQRPPLRSVGVVKSNEIRGRDAEDWLRDNWRPR